VQHERDALGRSEPAEYHEKREANRVGQQASCSESVQSSPFALGSASWLPSDSSLRDARERSMSRQTCATTVVSHPPRFPMPLPSERLSRSQIS
jgi:hypothetical protein